MARRKGLGKLGRYKLEKEIGRGTMGVVYQGFDPVIDRPVALKTVLVPASLTKAERQSFLVRFAQEAKIAGSLNHPNIVITYDAATDPKTGTPFIAMELVEGESLKSLVDREGRIPWQRAVDLLIPIANALDQAHGKGIVHRDVKPANVLLSKQGTPKITDFGIAKLSRSNLTKKRIILGTPNYLSPEQLRGEPLDGRSDQFCLGAVLYTMLTGAPPFAADELAVTFHQVVCQAPRPVTELAPEVPEEVVAVLARAMAKVAEERYPSCAAFAAALTAVRADLTAAQSGATLMAVSAPSGSRRKRALYGVLIVLALASGGYVALVGPKEAGRQARRQGARALTAMRDGGVKLASWLAELTGDLHSAQQDQARTDELSAQTAIHLAQATAAARQGQWRTAQRDIDLAVTSARQAADGLGEAAAVLTRARVLASQGAWQRAEAEIAAATAIFDIYDSAAGRLDALLCRAEVACELGELEQAQEDAGEAIRQAKLLGLSRRQVEARVLRARSWLLQGLVTKAGEELRQLQEQGAGEQETAVRVWLGIAAFVAGRAQEATDVWQVDTAAEPLTGEAEQAAELALLSGRVAVEQGRLEAAREQLSAARRWSEDEGDLPCLASAVESLRALVADQGDELQAQDLRAEAAQLRQRLGVAQEPAETGAARTDDPECQRLLAMLAARPLTAARQTCIGVVRQRCVEARQGVGRSTAGRDS